MFLTLITISASFLWTAVCIQKEVRPSGKHTARVCGSTHASRMRGYYPPAIHVAHLLPTRAAQFSFGKQIKNYERSRN
jgi:hypothetical protein